MGWTEIDQEDLVFFVVNEPDELVDEFGVLTGVEFAEKDGELGVVAARLKSVKDGGTTFVVGDVVGDEVVAAGGHESDLKVRDWQS